MKLSYNQLPPKTKAAMDIIHSRLIDQGGVDVAYINQYSLEHWLKQLEYAELMTKEIADELMPYLLAGNNDTTT